MHDFQIIPSSHLYAAQITTLFQETDETEDVPDVTLRQTEWSEAGLELEDVETDVVYNYSCTTIFDNYIKKTNITF